MIARLLKIVRWLLIGDTKISQEKKDNLIKAIDAVLPDTVNVQVKP